MTNPSSAVATSTGPGLGRVFVHPLFDALFIGGGLSLLLLGGPLLGDRGYVGLPGVSIITMVLLCNMAHFAASSVRLYSKPDAFRELPFHTMVLPLLTVLALTVAIDAADIVGAHVHALYLTWSPFHYAAQTYGLAAMYAMRSGCMLEPRERNLLWIACQVPFVYAFLAHDDAGLAWWLSPAFWAEHPRWGELRAQAIWLAQLASFAVPSLVALHLYARRSRMLPWMSWLLVLTNAVWWIGFTYMQAFGWATVFHGVQYLAIATIFHVRDHVPHAPVSRRIASAAGFYGVCLVLGYLLFKVWPYAYVGMGYPLADSMLLCTAIVNLHHFIVDRAIWRVRADRNREIVVG